MRSLATAGLALALAFALLGCAHPNADPPAAGVRKTFAPDPRERHFSELTMLTDGAENAEAYFAFGGEQLVFQSSRPPYACDQIYAMGLDGSAPRLVSTGRGRTTCSYFLPGDREILYASTHLASAKCPDPPDRSRGYVWPIYAEYDLFTVRAGGGEPRRLTDAPGYDAEATVSPRGDRIVFTSTRDGDLDIYSMKLDGSDVRRLTDEVGYDGGAFYSPDGRQIVYRAHHPEKPEEIAEYQQLLAEHMIRPGRLEIWIMNADGSQRRQVTRLGAASFAPFFHPSGKKIIFSTNYPDPRGREFDLYMVDLDGSNLERVTYSGDFDGFPMWAPDGRRFVFCSNRHNSKPGETNVFVTTWRD
ncbi:MAG: PD40 domain-containing protein [Acidobacteria bacterium]|nr:PD40 domain-containing protein [Acidobacteriota bacterium]